MFNNMYYNRIIDFVTRDQCRSRKKSIIDEVKK